MIKHLREALKKTNREEVVILTKTNSRSYDDVKRDLDRFRKEFGTDFIDSFTLGLESIEQLKDVLKRFPEASVRR
ncbi:MAG: hypothetical protein KAT15_24785 [Bacteroidales bacterium]|nr:hypothetical protein [Bacteroidales bacterium]